MSGSRVEILGNAESEVMRAMQWLVISSRGRLAVICDKVPATPSAHTVGTDIRPRWIDYGVGGIERGVSVLAPFPVISMHIKQAPAVRHFVSSDPSATRLKYRVFCQQFCVIATRKSCCRPRATGQFPFRFGWQPITGRTWNQAPFVDFLLFFPEFSFVLQ